MAIDADGRAAVERVFREEYGRLIASLVRRFGDIDIAEEAAGEALVAALEKWPDSGVPPNPGGWLTTTAGNRAIDRIRREKQRDAKHQAALMIYDDTAHRAHRTGRGRPVAAAVHLLPPGARAGGADRADAAAARRADRARDRAGVPRARDHDGAADHPREAEDRGGERALPGA